MFCVAYGKRHKKKALIPSRLRGRGVEVSKTLFYILGNYATALWKTNKNCKAILGELAQRPTLFYAQPRVEEIIRYAEHGARSE